MLLAIDTSTTQTGLACYNERGLLGECVWQSGRDHSAQLLPQLSLLLRHLGRGRDEISAVGVALGPGSWSGLRVGMSTAKGFALARGVTVIGVGTLDALAYQHDRAGVTTIPLIRLGRERFASGTMPRHGDKRRSIEPRNVTLAEIAAETTGRARDLSLAGGQHTAAGLPGRTSLAAPPGRRYRRCGDAGADLPGTAGASEANRRLAQK